MVSNRGIWLVNLATNRFAENCPGSKSGTNNCRDHKHSPQALCWFNYLSGDNGADGPPQSRYQRVEAPNGMVRHGMHG